MTYKELAELIGYGFQYKICYSKILLNFGKIHNFL